MASQWYCEHNGKTSGPFTPSHLRKLAGLGRLLPTDLVWRDDNPKKISASKITGLFDASQLSPQRKSPPPLPPSSSEVEDTPKATKGQSAKTRIALAATLLLIVVIGGWYGWKAVPAIPSATLTGANESKRQESETQAPKSSQNTSVDSDVPSQNVRIKRSPEVQQAIEAIKRMKGGVFFDETKPDQPVMRVVLENSQVRGVDLEPLMHLPTIEALHFMRTSVADISYMANLRNLRMLSTPALTPEQYETLAQLPYLDTLTTIYKPPVRGSNKNSYYMNQILTALSASQSLRMLRLDGESDKFPDDAFRPLELLPALVYLEIRGIGGMNDNHLASFGSCKKLEGLILHCPNYGQNYGRGFSSDGIKYLGSSGTLKSLVLRIADDDILAAVANIPSLTDFGYSLDHSDKVTDTMLIRLKKERPQLRLLDYDAMNFSPYR